MKLRSAWMVLFCLALASACGGTTSGGVDAGGGTDANTVDAAAVADSGPPDTGVAPALHGCAESDFVDVRGGTQDDRMIMVLNGTTTFDYPCMTISAGQSVMFMWDFAMHPLTPGVAPGETGTGTEPSPIQPQSSGVVYTPAFPTAGNYPFYCSNDFASGMMGVVRVLP